MNPTECLLWDCNVSLKSLNTFGFDVYAERLVRIKDINDIFALCADKDVRVGRYTILGGGSNVILRQNLPLVIRVETQGIEVLSEDENKITIRVAAGENWHQFVQTCLELGWFGLENLSLIPGTVGASPIQNIGAYGVEVKDYIEGVEAIELSTATPHYFPAAACQFGYRDSIFKREWRHKLFITHVTFNLSKVPCLILDYMDLRTQLHQNNIDNPTPKDIAGVVCQIRKMKIPDPNVLGNVGSFFKNPQVSICHLEALLDKYPNMPHYGQKLAAAWLIDQAGFKGLRQGNVGVHEKQALVLVNYGRANAEDIIHLAQTIQNQVKQIFDVDLTLEPDIIPSC